MRVWPALEVPRPWKEASDHFVDLLHDYEVTAIGEAGDVWQVVFPTSADRDAARAGIAAAYPNLPVTTVDVADEDWAARSQASLRAVRVGDLVVAPPWDIPAATDAVVIVIEPSMGFGTGHHETTRLCLAALQRLDLRGASLIDVGTGSGVLAFAAARLGAAAVVAIDHDPDAIRSAASNLRLNPGVGVELREVGLEAAPIRAFDVVVANLTGGVLVREASALGAWSAPSGSLVLSGFLLDEEASVIAAFPGMAATEKTAEGAWSCVRLEQAVRIRPNG